MNQEKETNQTEDFSLVETISESVSTDIVLDIKTGIYNLFVNLYKSQIPFYGPKGAIENSIAFLEEIIENFKAAITTE